MSLTEFLDAHGEYLEEIEEKLGKHLNDEKSLPRRILTYLSLYEKILPLYQRIYEDSEIISMKREEVTKLAHEYRRIQNAYLMKIKKGTSKKSIPKIRKRKSYIELSEKQKYTFLVDARNILCDIGVNRKNLHATPLGREPTENGVFPDSELLKIFAGDLIRSLSGLIDIEDIATQVAIESSNAASLGAVELGHSMKTIMEWGQGLVDEIESEVPNAIYLYYQWACNFRKQRPAKDELLLLEKDFGAEFEILESIRPKDSLKITKLDSFYQTSATLESSLEEEISQMLEKLNAIMTGIPF